MISGYPVFRQIDLISGGFCFESAWFVSAVKWIAIGCLRWLSTSSQWMWDIQQHHRKIWVGPKVGWKSIICRTSWWHHNYPKKWMTLNNNLLQNIPVRFQIPRIQLRIFANPKKSHPILSIPSDDLIGVPFSGAEKETQYDQYEVWVVSKTSNKTCLLLNLHGFTRIYQGNF